MKRSRTIVFLGLALLMISSGVQAADPPGFLLKWGSQGSGHGEFDNSRGIGVDPSGSVVYVAEKWNGRVQKFTPDGTYLDEINSFVSPRAVAVEADGTFYVIDTADPSVSKFSSSGSLIAKWGSIGSGNGQFAAPTGICVDGSGNVYVADTNNHRIQKFSSSGSFITAWGEWGNGNGQFLVPRGVAADGNGNVYVADSGNNRVQKFSSSGNFIRAWGSDGLADGQFQSPYSLCVDDAGNVYVADTNNHRVQEFTSNGVFVTKWGTPGSSDGQFASPQGIAVDVSGTVFVADTQNYRVQKFGAGGGTQTGIIDVVANPTARLYPSAPNPFLHRTTVRFEIEDPGQITLQVFDLRGRLVKTLTDLDSPPGTYSASWDGRNESGERVPAGAYFFRLVTRTSVHSQKVIRTK